MMDSIIETRYRFGKLTLIDATHLYPEDRKKYIELAKKHHVPSMAIVFNIRQEVLLQRDKKRDFPKGKRRIKQQVQAFLKNKRSIKKEGFHYSYVLNDELVDQVQLIRKNNPVEVEVGAGVGFIGDVHACYDELLEILGKLGYKSNEEGFYIHPHGRKFVSVGDIMSRGPRSLDCMIFMKKHVNAGLAYMIDSNHGWKVARWLSGRNVTMSHGDEKVVAEFEKYESNYGKEKTLQLKADLKDFLWAAPSHYVFIKNGVRVLVATHAGMKDEYIGKQSDVISDFCRYGDTAGFDEQGKPIRNDWYTGHKSKELIIWGHDPKPAALITNNTINIDQGVVFGGQFTAFKYPEKDFVSVKAKQDYTNDTNNPLNAWQEKRLNPPNLARYMNGYSVLTKHDGEIEIQEAVVKSAIDTVSHFTVPIEELVYIPPTMSPAPKASKLADYLEHPQEAFNYYISNGIQRMVAEKKHMGSRGILLLFKDKDSAIPYIGRRTLGTIYTRTGRPFFTKELEEEIVAQLNRDLSQSRYFEKYETDFILLDAEILPWNLKAKELINTQYTHVAEAALMDRVKLIEKLEKALKYNGAVEDWLDEMKAKLQNARVFNDVFQKYCWNIEGKNRIQIAPFHLLAHSDETYFDRSHIWHMEKNQEFSSMSHLFIETEFMVISDETSMKEAINWWTSLTEDGHEGFVIKPEYYLSRNEKGNLLQPAIKVRGRKYLHMIYGMDYLQPENLKRLKNRNVGKKQRHTLMEFSLGIEGVERFVHKDSIERIHECVLATLALEADPVDPRL
ncbi:AAA family ATPase [Bacillus aquiflavi]|uniref:AAA family ATPase n=1 Tax=Bacillus aquiflavi TaxID=2672567 RepID=UPI001FE2AAD4|nr:AAA family ATPase [Bacillus aquiflavi]